MTYKDWTLIDWDGNPALGLKCWRKKFRSGEVSVGVGKFLTVAFSYGADSDFSYSSTRWNYDNPVLTEYEAMDAIDKSNGRKMR
jgi:hypothetical protein